jgi:glucose/arabinose dehydrogenase
MLVFGLALAGFSACGDGEDIPADNNPYQPAPASGGSPAAPSASGGAPTAGAPSGGLGQEPSTGGVPGPGAGSGGEHAGEPGTGGEPSVVPPSTAHIPRCDPDGYPFDLPDTTTRAPFSERNCEPPEGDIPELRLAPVFGMREPVDMKAPPGDTERLFVVSRVGSVFIVKDGVVLEDPFLTVPVDSKYVECGLLGIAFHPEYADNGLFYLHYVTPRGPEESPGRVVIAEYERDPNDPDHALPEPRRILLDLEQPEHKHKGGSLEFDEQGRLLISVGNAGVSGTSLDPLDLRGKVLRILPAADSDGYEIPSENPQHEGWAPEVLETGLRNPWRIAVDRCTGDLFVGDVGTELYEEISLARAGENGNDFGFPGMEGPDCRPDWGDYCFPNQVPPIAGYAHDKGCAVVGGRVYRGHAIPALRGAYLFADACSGRIWALVPDGDGYDELELTLTLNECGVKGITSFGEDAAGELYVLSRGRSAVYRIQQL